MSLFGDPNICIYKYKYVIAYIRPCLLMKLLIAYFIVLKLVHYCAYITDKHVLRSHQISYFITYHFKNKIHQQYEITVNSTNEHTSIYYRTASTIYELNFVTNNQNASKVPKYITVAQVREATKTPGVCQLRAPAVGISVVYFSENSLQLATNFLKYLSEAAEWRIFNSVSVLRC